MFYNQIGTVPTEIRLTFYQDRKYKIEKREVHDDKDCIRIFEKAGSNVYGIWNAVEVYLPAYRDCPSMRI